MSLTQIDPKCQEVVELMNDYLGHRLTDEDRIAFEKHLYTCPPCTMYLEQLKTVLNVAASLDKGAPAPGVEVELLNLFQSWSDKGQH